jgi:hypothetical protein
MNRFARCCLLALAFVAPSSHAAAPDPSLVGCWRAVKIVLYAQDGSRTEDSSGRCTLRFQDDQFESTCATSSGAATTSYRYHIERPGFYLATMAASTFRTHLIGAVREYEYRVDGDRLVTVTRPQAASPTVPTAALRVESEAARTACP